jgi:hypothetical protein
VNQTLRSETFCLIGLISIGLASFLSRGLALDETIPKSTHDLVVQELRGQVSQQRAEGGIIIASMASALAFLYVTSRKDTAKSREVIQHLADALQERPCLRHSRYIAGAKSEAEKEPE